MLFNHGSSTYCHYCVWLRVKSRLTMKFNRRKWRNRNFRFSCIPADAFLRSASYSQCHIFKTRLGVWKFWFECQNGTCLLVYLLLSLLLLFFSFIKLQIESICKRCTENMWKYKRDIVGGHEEASAFLKHMVKQIEKK